MAIPVLANGHTPEADWLARRMFGTNTYLAEPKSGPFVGKIYHLGIHVCRKIAGSSSWSDHAFGAALDVGVKPAFRTKAFFDEVKAYMLAAIEDAPHDLRVRLVLSWTTSHFDHLHWSVGPQPTGTPPCAGGPQGSIVQPWPLEEEDWFDMFKDKAELKAWFKKELLGGLDGSEIKTAVNFIQGQQKHESKATPDAGAEQQGYDLVERHAGPKP